MYTVIGTLTNALILAKPCFGKKQDCRSRPELGFWVEPEPEPLFLQEPKVILTLIVFKFFLGLKSIIRTYKVTDLKSNNYRYRNLLLMVQ